MGVVHVLLVLQDLVQGQTALPCPAAFAGLRVYVQGEKMIHQSQT